MSSINSEPPPTNPILTAYENFVQNTPYITRTIISIQGVSYLISWFFDAEYALGNIPHFTIFRFEIYRIVLSPLVNSSLLSLIFAYWSFKAHGKRLEHSMGSTAFAWLCLMMAVLSNLAFIVLCFVMYILSGEESILFNNSSGIWIILFGIIAMECVRAPRGSKLRLFVADVPVLYYPLALYALFALLGQSFLLAHLLSIVLGYLIGYTGEISNVVTNHLERVVLINSAKAKEWEDNYLSTLTSRPGWIVGNAANGSGAWSEEETTGMVRIWLRMQRI